MKSRLAARRQHKRARSSCRCGNPLRASGQDNCNECHAAKMRAWRKARGGNKGMSPEARKRSNARAYLHVYIKRGKVIKGVCEVCGTPEVESHHVDYNKPLEVRWLCKADHREVTNRMKKNNEIITEILIEQLGCHEEQVVPEAVLDADLAMDSLDQIEIGLALEEAFDLELQDEDVAEWRTVGDIQKALAEAKQRDN